MYYYVMYMPDEIYMYYYVMYMPEEICMYYYIVYMQSSHSLLPYCVDRGVHSEPQSPALAYTPSMPIKDKQDLSFQHC